MAYVGITHDGKNYWGAGMDEDIIKASIHALVVAVNKLPEMTKDDNHQDDRLVSMLNYIQTNYQTVTLENMAEQFLSLILIYLLMSRLTMIKLKKYCVIEDGNVLKFALDYIVTI